MTDAMQGEGAAKSGRYRWTVCALLFFATTINYIDRQVLGILAPVLQKEIGWTEMEYGYIVTAFQAAYAIGLVFAGRLIDRFGTKIGFSIAIVVWSIAAMGHAAVRSVMGFGAARFALGLGESANFPAAIKAVAEWFPKRERAFATGIFNSGANIGAVAAPAVVPWLTLTYGWQASFFVTGAIGFVWLVCWVAMYEAPERHKRVSPAELSFIQSDPPDPPSAKIPWSSLFRHRQTWAFVIGKFLTDPIWWFYLYWLPKFLNTNYGLTLDKLGAPLIVIYTLTSVGSIGGGWLSGSLIRRGWPVSRARKAVMLLCALCIIPIVFAAGVTSLWLAVGIIGLAAAAHQGWSANLFTTASDMFPRKAVGSVVGLGGMAGAVGGMLLATFAGFVLEWTGNYMILFIISGSAYVVALGIFTLLVPKLAPVQFEGA
jgi:ACS family hexuronate transporter-like MFS transporter